MICQKMVIPDFKPFMNSTPRKTKKAANKKVTKSKAFAFENKSVIINKLVKQSF